MQDRINRNLYIDGTQATQGTLTDVITSNASALNIGQFYDGILDEIRISDTARTADWIKASYWSDSDALVTYGSQESLSVNATWSPLTSTMTVAGDLTMTGGTFNTSSGTANVTVNGTVQCGATCGTINMTSTNTFTQSVSAAENFGTNVAVATDWSFYNLIFNSSSGTPTITVNSTGTGEINVTNNLFLTNSGTSLILDNETNDRILDVTNVSIGLATTLQASSTAAFKVAGTWSNSGNFTDGTGTVTLDGTGLQTLSGQMTGASDRFYDLTITNASASGIDFNNGAETANNYTITTAGVTVTYQAAQTYTFQNINWLGASGVGNEIDFNSSTTSDWNLVVGGTQTSVSYVDVEYSYACGGDDIDATTSATNTNSGNNDCWLFPATGINVAGISNSTGTVKIAVNGILQTASASISGGNWNLDTNSVLSGGETVTAFIDGAIPSNEATGVTEYDGTGDITGMTLARNVLVIASDDTGVTLTVTQLGQYDNDQDEDIMHTANAGVLNVDDDSAYTDDDISIGVNDTLTMDSAGTMNADNVITNSGSSLISDGANNYNVTGDWWNNGGTFTSGASTLTMSGTGTLTSGG